MTWKRLLANRCVETHVTSRQELDDLRRAVNRNVHDAALEGLSADNQFGLAYEAALLLGKMAVTCAGYRVKGLGAHHTTFVALELAMGPGVTKTAAYLDRCRRKRNDLSYDTAGVVSTTEAAELLAETKKLRKSVETWIAEHYHNFA